VLGADGSAFAPTDVPPGRTFSRRDLYRDRSSPQCTGVPKTDPVHTATRRPRGPRRGRAHRGIASKSRSATMQGMAPNIVVSKRADALVQGDHVLVPGIEGTVMVDEVERREDDVRVRLQADDRWFSLRTDELVAIMKQPG
jgi:hypothetical protein